jgi:hypothetical protein
MKLVVDCITAPITSVLILGCHSLDGFTGSGGHFCAIIVLNGPHEPIGDYNMSWDSTGACTQPCTY